MTAGYELLAGFIMAFAAMLIFGYLFITYLSCFVVARRHGMKTSVALSMSLLTFALVAFYSVTTFDLFSYGVTGEHIPRAIIERVMLGIRVFALVSGVALIHLMARLASPEEMDTEIEDNLKT